MPFISNSKGFSLVELMIGIIIFATLAAMALPTYRAFVQNTRIRSTAESISNGLQLARAEAVKRNASVQFSLDSGNWTVGCFPPVITDNNGDGIPDCPAIIQTRPIAESGNASALVITTAPSGTQVVFNNLGLIAPTPNTFNRVDIDVNSATLPSADSRELRIFIGLGGNARMCDPNVTTSGDTRKC